MRYPPRTATARRFGYTLLELLVVVAIVGVLASIAVPGWRMYSARARRTEALLALKSVHELQVAFYSENDQYADSFLDLGFDIGGPGLQPDGTVQGVYYTYVLETWDLGDKSNANFRATASGDVDPSDAILDVVVIENDLAVVQ